LRGKTLGIVGYGSIGREVARLARAFGMSVLAIKRDLRFLDETSFRQEETGDPMADIPDRIYPVTAIKSVMRASDYVVVTTPLTEHTYHLIDRVVIESMKPDAIIINVARGAVIDEAALIKALERGEIGGAGLDVFEEEPLPEDSPLWDLDNVILSPHVSGFTPEYDERATDLFAENLRRFVIGETLINQVERGRGY
jgi:phosphoglycerate dehydrogenase-like enzyme